MMDSYRQDYSRLEGPHAEDPYGHEDDPNEDEPRDELQQYFDSKLSTISVADFLEWKRTLRDEGGEG